MQDLNDLFYFVQVVDHGGFAPAGRALGVPKSTLSRRVAVLEARLGAQLIHRTTRSVSVTELGQEYYRHCVAMLVEADAAQEAVERRLAQPQGLVHLSCPPGLLCFLVAPLISRFMEQYPRVQVQLEATNRRVDVVREGFDLALRVRFPPLADSDLSMRVLSKSPHRLMAAPELFAESTQPAVPEDLHDFPTLGLERHGTTHIWHLNGPDGATARIEHHPRLVTDDVATLRRAAIDGHGVVQLPLIVGGNDIAAGTLVDVLPDWVPRDGIFHAIFPSRRGLLPSVRALIDYLADNLEDVDFIPHDAF